ncbi:TPR-like protein [Athelia psychrophila]|uniref:TPR-like protein n=1 Tax=Athelia psychrophila TaxID=1759441 RepID=A0A166IH61_9AGAM|nr:TPR-like protein [Fibularhizoctonia sp. CBS 109695]
MAQSSQLQPSRNANVVNRNLAASSSTTDPAISPAVVCRSQTELAHLISPKVFNTIGTSGGNVTNISRQYITYKSPPLDKLVRAEGASWNPDLACLPGTRLNILSVIHAWSRSLDAQNVLWLKGVAGSGKSAIAHTVAQALCQDGLLASSFFFDRNDASRNTSQHLFTTIARDIAARYPAIAADINTALENDPSLASASISRQFEAFIAGPLRRHPIDHPIVVVIDALDETLHGDSDTTLLSILRDKASDLPPQLRILVTSRPIWNVEQFLSGKDHIKSHSIDINSVDNRQDISAYINAQLRGDAMCSKMGPNWPDEQLINDLELLAEGLFIWIATICSYLHSAYNPRKKLEALLSKPMPQGLAASKKMDDLYAYILEICADWEDVDFLEDYDLIMGTIMAAKRPLSVMALNALHGGSHSMDISTSLLLERFGSVLMGFQIDHEPIRMLHVSFREFITNRANNAPHTRKFYISEKAHSQRLAGLCIQTIVREFSATNITGTGYLDRDDDRPGIPEVTGVSEQLLYSCESWSDHISDVTEPNTALVEQMKAFLSHHRHTVWMEIVSSKSRFLGSLSALRWSEVSFYGFLSLRHSDLIDRPAAFNADLAMSLNNLSNRLSGLGRKEEALKAIQEAVDLHRILAAERPAAFNADLATSLNNLSNHLSGLGRKEEALKAIQEAVDLRRILAAERPAAFNAELAMSLNNLSNRLSGLGRKEEALKAILEAVGLDRILVAERPAAFNADLAMSLSNLSNLLSDLGRKEEALKAIQEAVDLHRILAAERPAAFNADLAKSLNNLSNRLSGLGRKEEALKAIQEAVDLYRILVAERPAAFNADLAMSLNNLSVHLSGLGRKEEALKAIQEAVDLSRILAAERPAAFNADLATSLSNLSNRLSGLGRKEEALKAIQEEAIDLHRILAAERPAAFNADLANSLRILSSHLSGLGRKEEALNAIQEAVGLYCALAAEQPAAFSADLAMSLNNLSSHFSRLGQKEEALNAIQEAVGLYRAFAEERPAQFNADLATSLNNLSNRLSCLDQREEALKAIQEAVGLYRALAAEQPAAFNADLAMSLNNLSNRFSGLGRKEEALKAIQEAVDLHRILAAEQPAAFNADLAMSLNNLSNHLSGLGRKEEALKAIQEAVDLRRILAAERPAVFNVNLATSLCYFSYHLLCLDRKEEALNAIQEAVGLWRPQISVGGVDVKRRQR